MDYRLIIISLVTLAVLAGIIFLFSKWFDKDRVAQRALNEYLNRNLSPEEVGRFYERYIGHLYETKGHDVIYHGAVNGYADLGRDLIVRCDDEVRVIQTKCWAKYKQIPEAPCFREVVVLVKKIIGVGFDNYTYCAEYNFTNWLRLNWTCSGKVYKLTPYKARSRRLS